METNFICAVRDLGSPGDEVLAAMSSLKGGKAGGKNGVLPEMLSAVELTCYNTSEMFPTSLEIWLHQFVRQLERHQFVGHSWKVVCEYYPEQTPGCSGGGIA